MKTLAKKHKASFLVAQSRLYEGTLAVLHVSVLVLIFLLQPPPWLGLLLTLGVVVNGVLCALNCRRSRTIKNIVVEEGELFLTLKDTSLAPVPVTLHHSSVITSFIQVLRFKVLGSGVFPTVYSLVLLSDSGDAETLRALRVWVGVRAKD